MLGSINVLSNIFGQFSDQWLNPYFQGSVYEATIQVGGRLIFLFVLIDSEPRMQEKVRKKKLFVGIIIFNEEYTKNVKRQNGNINLFLICNK